MEITDRILGALNLTTEAQAEARASIRATRAYEQAFNDSGNDEPVSGTLRSFGYKEQTRNHLRNLKTGYDKIVENMWLLYQSNPVAKRVLRIKVSHLLGSGIEYKSDDETLTELLDEFWKRNKLASELRKFVLQLHLWGEQVYPAFVRQADGRVTLGYIDPGQIKDIINHPDNAMRRWMVVLKESATTKTRVYRVIMPDEDTVTGSGDEQKVQAARHPGMLVMADQANIQVWEMAILKEHGLTEYTGSCFLFQINNVSNQSRGFSDLLQSADWIDVLDDTLFAVGDREQFASFFSWDVELTGATEEKVRERAAEIRATPPKRGSVRVHNDNEEWTLNWPDLKQMGSIETVKAVLSFALGGLGFPLHWFGFGDGTNRATAMAQGDPTWKTLEEEQDGIKEMVIFLLTFVRDQALIAGLLPGTAAEATIEVSLPQMTKRDLQALTTSMGQLSSALMVAEQQGWSSKEQAITVWQKMIQEMGVEPEDVQELLDQQPEEADEDSPPTVDEDQLATADAVNKFLNGKITDANA